MSRYSPNVLPIAGATFADSLLQGVNAYMDTRAKKRREKFEDSAETRAGNVDSRAQAQLVINQDENTRAAGRYGAERAEDPLRMGMLESDARRRGVLYRNSGQPLPPDAVNIRGVPDYAISDSATEDERRRAAAAGLANIRATVDREGMRSRENIARINAGSRETVARTPRPGAGGGAGGRSDPTLTTTAAQARRARTTVEQLRKLISDTGGDQDSYDALREAEEELDFYDSQYQSVLQSRQPVPTRTPKPQGGPSLFAQPFSSMFGGTAPAPMAPGGAVAPPVMPQMPARPAAAPRVPAATQGAGPASLSPRQSPGAAPAAGTPPPAGRKTRAQIEGERKMYMGMGLDPSVVEAKYREQLAANGYR